MNVMLRSCARHVGAAAACGAAVLLVATPQAQHVIPTDRLVEVQSQWAPQRPAALLDALRTATPYVPGEVLVKFRAGAAPAARQASLTAAQTSVASDEARWLGDTLLVRFPAEPDAERLASLLSLQPDVEYAMPNYIRQLQRTPTDSETGDRAGGTICPAGADGDAPSPETGDSAGEGSAGCPPGEGVPAPAREERATDTRPAPQPAFPSVAGDQGGSRARAARPAPAGRASRPGVIIGHPGLSAVDAAVAAATEAAGASGGAAQVRSAGGGAAGRPTVPQTSVRPGEVSRTPPTPLTPSNLNTTQQWNLTLLNMPAAWDINPGASAQVTVAVIDSGVTTVTQNIPIPLIWNGSQLLGAALPFAVNPDLEGARLVGGRDFTFVPAILGNPERVMDMHGHGTHVAGTIAQSTTSGLGAAGMAYRARIMPLKACVGFWEIQMLWAVERLPGTQSLLPFGTSACTDDAIIAAIRYAADQGATVINLSLGSAGNSPAILDAIQYAVGRGAFVVAAVGNEFDRGNAVSFPAGHAPDVAGLVAVGAIDRNLQRAYYSNAGPHVTLAAPGGDIRGGPAGGIYQVAPDRSDFHPANPALPRFDLYRLVSLQGTSMAAPHVSGLAALLVSQGITRPAAIEAAMKRFARDLGPPGPDHEYGHGVIQPRETLRGLGLLR